MSLYKVHILFTLIKKQYIFEGKHKKLPKRIFSALKLYVTYYEAMLIIFIDKNIRLSR